MRGALNDVELLDLAVRLDDDPARRHVLDRGWDFFQAAVAEGRVGRMDIDQFAVSVGNAVRKGFLTSGSQNGGQELPPIDIPWNGTVLQARHEYEPTLDGRRLVETARNTSSATAWPEKRSDPVTARARKSLRAGARADAMVAAVEALESHLHELAREHDVSLATDDGSLKRLAHLNDQLHKAGAYGKGAHAQVSSWLHDRNDIAHAKGAHLSNDRLGHILDGVDVFVKDTSNAPTPSTP